MKSTTTQRQDKVIAPRRGKLAMGLLDFGGDLAGRAAASIAGTIHYARNAERLGFDSIWLGEHHAERGIWGSPLLPMSAVAENTRTIKVGSGGILLLAHNAFLAASDFAFLASRHGTRVQVGLARGLPNSGLVRAMTVSSDLTGGSEAAAYESRVALVCRILRARQSDDGLAASLPPSFPTPAIWILGTSGLSLSLARRVGLRYVHSCFFQRADEPAVALGERDAIALAFVCRETEGEAKHFAAEFNHHFVRPRIIGDGDQCVAAIARQCEAFGVRTALLLDCGPYEDRNLTLAVLADALRRTEAAKRCGTDAGSHEPRG